MRMISDFITDKSSLKGSVCKSILSFLLTDLFFSPVVFLKVGKIYETANTEAQFTCRTLFCRKEVRIKNRSLVSLTKSEDKPKYF